jgi:hypothetical protein
LLSGLLFTEVRAIFDEGLARVFEPLGLIGARTYADRLAAQLTIKAFIFAKSHLPTESCTESARPGVINLLVLFEIQVGDACAQSTFHRYGDLLERLGVPQVVSFLGRLYQSKLCCSFLGGSKV